MMKSDTVKENSNKIMTKMKGQAIPLFAYHILRDNIVKTITGDHQNAILYWLGKDLALQFNASSIEECANLFLELGWGYLEEQQSSSTTKTFTLTSPFFHTRKVTNNTATFSLECGFLAQQLAMLEEKHTEGHFEVAAKQTEIQVLFKINLQEKEVEEG